MKDSSGDLTQAVEYLLTPKREALLFSGRDTVALSMLVHGAHGTISPAANVFPELMVRMYERFRLGDLDGARRISDVFAPLRAAWALGSFPVVIKEAMVRVGSGTPDIRVGSIACGDRSGHPPAILRFSQGRPGNRYGPQHCGCRFLRQ